MTDENPPPARDDLVEIEAIKRLKYRYARLLDQKEWDALGECFAEDATASYGGGDDRLVGREAIIRYLRDALSSDSRITSHAVGQPEIELTGIDSATGVWALQDLVIDTEAGFEVRGGSFYEDRYVKRDGVWRFAHTGYRRVYEELAPRREGVRLTASWWGTGGRSELNG